MIARACRVCGDVHEIELADELDAADEASVVALARCPSCGRRDPHAIEAAAFGVSAWKVKDGFEAGLFAGVLLGALASVPLGTAPYPSGGVGAVLGIAGGIVLASWDRVRRAARDADALVTFRGRVDRAPEDALVPPPEPAPRQVRAAAAVWLPGAVAGFAGIFSLFTDHVAPALAGTLAASILAGLLSDGDRALRIRCGLALGLSPLMFLAVVAIARRLDVAQDRETLFVIAGVPTAIASLAAWAAIRKLAGAKIP